MNDRNGHVSQSMQAAITRLLWNITSSPLINDTSSVNKQKVLRRSIPEDIFNSKSGLDARMGFGLIDGEIESYWEIWSILRDDLSTEHKTDRELADEIWRTVCVCLLRRDELTTDRLKLIPLVLELLDRTTAPPDEFLFIRALQNVTISTPITLSQVVFRECTAAELVSLGFNLERARATGLELDSFGAAVISERGTSADAAQRRASESLERAMDEFRYIAAHAMMRHLGDDQINSNGSWFRLRKSTPVTHAHTWGKIDSRIKYTAPDFTKLPYSNAFASMGLICGCSESVQQSVRRALRWYSRFLLAEEEDFKLISLCVCLESLLSSTKKQNDYKKLQQMYLSLMIAENVGFLNPWLVLRLFEMRGELVHGHSIDLRAEDDFYSFQYLVREAISTFVAFANKFPATTKKSLLLGLERSTSHHRAGELIRDPNSWWNKMAAFP